MALLDSSGHINHEYKLYFLLFAVVQGWLVFNVLFILLDGRVGGPQTRIIRTAPDLRKHGIDTCLMVPDTNTDLEYLAKENRVAVKVTPILPLSGCRSAPRVFSMLLKLISSIWSLKKYLEQQDGQVVVIHGGFFVQAALASKFAGKRIIWFLNDTSLSEKLTLPMSWLIRSLSSTVIVQGERVRVHYHIPNKNIYELYTPTTLRVTDKEKRMKSNCINIGMLGNWSPVKDLLLFVRTIAELRNITKKKVAVSITGKKLKTQHLYVQKVENEIKKLGLEEIIDINEFTFDVVGFYEQIDILLLTSKSEASPGIVSEAMSQGVPVVSTNVGSVPDMISRREEHSAGIVVNDSSPKNMALAIIDICKDDATYEAFSRAGKQKCKEELNAAEYAKQFANIVKSTICELP